MDLETKALGSAEEASVAELLYAFEDFKQTNDQRLADIERRGSADPLLSEKVERLNAVMTRQQSALDRLAAEASRPQTANGADLVSEEKQAFDAYIRAGNAIPTELKSLAGGSGDGAVLSPQETSDVIDLKLRDASPMRQLATVRRISANVFRKPVPLTPIGAGWVGETAARPETTTPTLVAIDFPAMELYAMPAATQALLDDTVVDLSAWLAEEIQAEFAAQESAAFVSGDGVNKPRGILDYSTAPDDTRAADELGTTPSSGATIDADDLIDLIYTLPQAYRQNGRFMMNRSTLASIRKLKDTEGNYLWSPGLGGQTASLLGFSITESEHMPDVANGETPIAFGDFQRGYLIVDRAGVGVLRDPYSAKPYVLFYTTKRVGGGIQDYAALKLLQMSA
ncbi:major capsid protein, HK97 family protein [Parvularcula bermudensis HTCC2503]|uniref:Major capsid protein, HK97 family protein n=1 Tax=Parvularcula bermudensis (strain ATCC BAA-594 / HTCC2503 / KCTC 12087) TaxID=314260 RepID=E0THR4_PARBH|nr:phage major capsid protein [Parvularcula bermudensis]ADM09671.1 major capsid protein, HK97 family protein [Parvularcula bermudensis HTCC2503]